MGEESTVFLSIALLVVGLACTAGLVFVGNELRKAAATGTKPAISKEMADFGIVIAGFLADAYAKFAAGTKETYDDETAEKLKDQIDSLKKIVDELYAQRELTNVAATPASLVVNVNAPSDPKAIASEVGASITRAMNAETLDAPPVSQEHVDGVMAGKVEPWQSVGTQDVVNEQTPDVETAQEASSDEQKPPAYDPMNTTI